MRWFSHLWWQAWPPGPLSLIQLGIILVNLAAWSMAQECPEKCLCPSTSNQVLCEGAGFLDIPRGLPPSISTLDMSNNNIMSLSSAALDQLRNVITMKLKGNDISTIHNGAFSSMTSLQRLDLSSNDLETLTEYSLQGPTSLLHLDLSGNRLKNVEGAFAGMSELSRLDLSNNQIEALTQFTFRDLSNIHYLLLTENKISEIDRRAFRNLGKLNYLVLRGNPIGQVTRYQFHFLSLSYLDMSECGLTRVPRGLPNSIRYLQLRRNNMTVIHRHAFQDCPYVTILVLDENSLTEIQDKTFEHMTYLQQLWLNNNALRAIPKPLPPSLERVLMDSNQLMNVTNVFPSGSLLNKLSFMGNNISHVSYDAFYNLPLLKSLDLSNNRIQHLYGNTFINATKLNTLQLSKNPLTYFHSRCFHGLTGLETLSLAYVSTRVSMYWDIFFDLVRLTKLDLDSSPYVIRSILGSDQLLAGLNGVEDLSMHSSDITTIREDFMELFPNLLELHISSTRWHCDTSLLWFRSWLLMTEVHVENKEDLKCFTPRAVHDRSIIAMAEFEFVTTIKTSPPPIVTARLTTFTTDKPSTRTTTSPVIEGSATEPPDDNSYEDNQGKEDNPFVHILPGPENPDRTPPPLPNFVSQSGNGPGIISPVLNGSSPEKNGEASILPPSGEKLPVPNDNLSLQTSPKDAATLQPVPTPSSDKEGEKSGNTMMLIIIATTLVTVVIAAILIATIVYFSRKSKKRAGTSPSKTKQKRKKGSSSNKGQGLYQNGIKYKHKNDVLYFMPASAEGSTTDSLNTNTSATKEANMSLVPGRDINHEGPLRCYKWEDF